jgi:hypothetical protein
MALKRAVEITQGRRCAEYESGAIWGQLAIILLAFPYKVWLSVESREIAGPAALVVSIYGRAQILTPATSAWLP